MKRADHVLVVENHDGTFMFYTGSGWADCTAEQIAFIAKAERSAAKMIEPVKDGRKLRSNEVPVGLTAFGTPFFIRRNK